MNRPSKTWKNKNAKEGPNLISSRKAGATTAVQPVSLLSFSEQSDGGLIKQVLVCSNVSDAEAYLSIFHTRFDLHAVRFIALGNCIPKTLTLPKAKITLLFDNDLLGKLWDIKIACLIRKKTVSISYDRQFIFQLSDRQCRLNAEQVSLSAFEKNAGIRTGIKTAKGKGHTTFLQQLIHDSS
ncbi:MAG: hypothetical protein JST19_19090 [Bacteroidetes bacterium]|nr:hypothetical protein [Bacteroidota bacterium]